MADTARDVRPLGAFLAVQKAVRDAQLFRLDRDRHVYLDLLKRVAADAATVCEGFCLLDDAALAVVLAAGADQACAMLKRTQTLYAGYLREVQGGRDRLWGPHIGVCELRGDDRWSALAYVENAPVRAGLCARAGQHAWSSAPAHLGLMRPHRLLSLDGWLLDWESDAWEMHLERMGRDYAFWRKVELSAARPAARRKKKQDPAPALAQFAAASHQGALLFVD